MLIAWCISSVERSFPDTADSVNTHSFHSYPQAAWWNSQMKLALGLFCWMHTLYIKELPCWAISESTKASGIFKMKNTVFAKYNIIRRKNTWCFWLGWQRCDVWSHICCLAILVKKEIPCFHTSEHDVNLCQWAFKSLSKVISITLLRTTDSSRKFHQEVGTELWSVPAWVEMVVFSLEHEAVFEAMIRVYLRTKFSSMTFDKEAYSLCILLKVELQKYLPKTERAWMELNGLKVTEFHIFVKHSLQ